MLTDTSLENLEYLVLERAGLSAMDLSWNMLSAKAVKKLGTSRILLKHFRAVSPYMHLTFQFLF
jgi:hypothetical protein